MNYNAYVASKNELLKNFAKVAKFGDFTLSSGKKSDFYIDCKEILLTRCVMINISHCITYLTRELGYNVIAGLTSGADPIVCAQVAYGFADRSGLFVRKEQKSYGTEKLIEGSFKTGDKVLIVDAVLTTGDSLKYVYNILVSRNLVPVGAVVLVDRQENDTLTFMSDYMKIPIMTIMTREEIFTHVRKK